MLTAHELLCSGNLICVHTIHVVCMSCMFLRFSRVRQAANVAGRGQHFSSGLVDALVCEILVGNAIVKPFSNFQDSLSNFPNVDHVIADDFVIIYQEFVMTCVLLNVHTSVEVSGAEHHGAAFPGGC